ncbi:MAG: ribonuclease E/G [Acetobacteraceae bacterium]|nr:ribonuclease E/G [Acetobacteraceae bacterium]
MASPGEVRVAVARGDDLLDYAIWRPGAPDGVGDLHRGRIIARVPALAGSFVTLEGEPDGFLPDSEGGARLTEGMLAGVRISRAAQGGKGPRLTARLTEEDQRLAGSGPVRRIRRGPGAVERLAACYPEAPVLADDAGLAATLREKLGPRISVAQDLPGEALAGRIAALHLPEVPLPSGGRLSIHPTPALVAIDMDTGSASAARAGKSAAQLAANRAMLPALAREIRLRNLSGAIVVDFAGLSPRRRAQLGPALAAALADDPLHPRLLGFTALGLAEIVRTRIHPPLHELLAGPHAAGLEALRQLAHEISARPARPPALRVTPAIAAALDADPLARAELAHRAGRPLMLRTDPALPAPGWLIEDDAHG